MSDLVFVILTGAFFALTARGVTNSPYLKPMQGCALRARPGRKVAPVPDQYPTEDMASAALEPIDCELTCAPTGSAAVTAARHPRTRSMTACSR